LNLDFEFLDAATRHLVTLVHLNIEDENIHSHSFLIIIAFPYSEATLKSNGDKASLSVSQL
jgi:hypothetical protein